MALAVEYTPKRHPGRWIALAFVIIILGLSAWVGYRWYTTGELPIALPVPTANQSVDETYPSFDQVRDYTVAANEPRYITIPRLKSGKTRIYQVSLDHNNIVESPANINDAGWYKKSAAPGNHGVTLINGHNEGVNKNGAFHNLGILVKDDKITVELGNGKTYTYSVVENQSMTIEEVNTKGMAMMAKSAIPGKEALNLMTFDGKWVPRLNMFDRRIMLRAVLDDQVK